MDLQRHLFVLKIQQKQRKYHPFSATQMTQPCNPHTNLPSAPPTQPPPTALTIIPDSDPIIRLNAETPKALRITPSPSPTPFSITLPPETLAPTESEISFSTYYPTEGTTLDSTYSPTIPPSKVLML
jgi:hypothetical protein